MGCLWSLDLDLVSPVCLSFHASARSMLPLTLIDSIETAVVIICACIPTLPQLVLLLLRKDQKPTQYEPERQMRSPPVKSDYDQVRDGTTNPSRRDEVEMHRVSNDSSMTRTMNVRTHWESV